MCPAPPNGAPSRGAREPVLPARGTEGFALLEVLLALSLAALLLVMLSRSLLSIWHGTLHAREDLQGTMIARSVLEEAMPRASLAPGIKQGTSGGYAWRVEIAPASARVAAVSESNLPNDMQVDLMPGATSRWRLYRLRATVTSPTGRRVALEAFELGN